MRCTCDVKRLLPAWRVFLRAKQPEADFMAVSPQRTGANHDYTILLARGAFFEICTPHLASVESRITAGKRHKVKLAQRYNVNLHLGLLQLAIRRPPLFPSLFLLKRFCTLDAHGPQCQHFTRICGQVNYVIGHVCRKSPVMFPRRKLGGPG